MLAFGKRIAELFVSTTEADKHNNINIVRFVAASMVIYGHMAHLADYPVPKIFGQEIAGVAVKIFFVLSGYLIAKSFDRDQNILRYAIRRFFRIMPGLIFLVIVTVFFIGPILTTGGKLSYFTNPNTYTYLLNALLNPVYNLPGVFSNNPYPNAVNGSLWTLPVEVSMYIILPFIVCICKKASIKSKGMAAVAIISLLISVLVNNLQPDLRIVFWGSDIVQGLVLIPYFFAGAFFSSAKLQNSLNLQIGLAAVFFAAILSLRRSWEYELVLFIMLPYTVLAFSFAAPSIFGRLFAKNDYSYGIYLWGFLVQQIMIKLLGVGNLTILQYALVCLVVTLLFALISWHIIEKPCNNLGKYLIKTLKAKEVNRLSSA